MAKRHIIIAIIILCCFTRGHSLSLTVETDSVGTLSTLIGNSYKTIVNELTVKGAIDGDDIRYLREMAGRDVNGNAVTGKLLTLDLSEAKITEGGEAYCITGGTSYFTKADDMGTFMFYQSNLTSLKLPQTLKAIGYQAFSRSAITQIDIPDGVDSISTFAFSDCTAMKRVILGDSVSSMGTGVFSGCTALISFMSSGTKYISPDSCCLLSREDGKLTFEAYAGGHAGINYLVPDSCSKIAPFAFSGSTEIKEVTAGDGITAIGESAFQDCTKLQYVSIGANVKEIGDYAFSGCTSLTDFHCQAANPPAIEDYDQFFNAPIESAALYVPTYNYGQATVWNEFGKQMLIMAFNSKAAGTFAAKRTLLHPAYSMIRLTGPINDADLNYVRELATKDAAIIDLQKAEILPGGGSYMNDYKTPRAHCIGRHLFENLSATRILLPIDIDSIGDSAFVDCNQLTSIYLPKAVENVATTAFIGCPVLEEISADGESKKFATSGGVLYNKAKSVLLAYPNGGAAVFDTEITTTVIGDDAFHGCEKLRTLNMTNGVLAIGNHAFHGCTGLKKMIIPMTVKSIGNCSFYGCTGLRQFYVNPSNNNYMSVSGVLYDRTKYKLIAFPNLMATTFEIPKGITTIVSGAFGGCGNVESIIIPATVTTIEDYAFDVNGDNGVSALNYLKCNVWTPLTINATVFGNLEKSNVTLVVPIGAPWLYKLAPEWKDFNIEEAGISHVNANKLRYSTPGNGELTIEGASEGTEITVYTLSGMKAASTTAKSQPVTMELPTAGIYIVTAGTETKKIRVN
jgi:hypothetical protein